MKRSKAKSKPTQPTSSLIVVRASDVTPKPIEWLWQGRFARGRLSVICAPPGTGKSYLTCKMAAHVSQSVPWPDGAACGRGSVVLVTCEDNVDDTVVPRLEAVGADMDRVYIVKGMRRIDPRTNKVSETVFTLQDLKPLQDLLRELGDVRLVVIDPIGSYFGDGKDSFKDNEVRSVLAPLGMLAERYNVAMALVAHNRKSHGGTADDAVLGSRAFTGLARTVHHMFKDPQNRHRRLFLPGKNNLSEEMKGLAFRLDGVPLPDVVFENNPARVTADEMAAQLARKGGNGARAPKGAAQEWLEELLADGPMEAGEVQRLAKAAGIPWRSVQRACQELGVKPRRSGFGATGGWAWAMPTDPIGSEIESDDEPDSSGSGGESSLLD